DDKELAVAVEASVRPAGHAERAFVEGELVVLRGHLAAARPGAGGVAALYDPILHSVELEAIEEARIGLLLEVGYRVAHARCRVRCQAAHNRALRGLDYHYLHCCLLISSPRSLWSFCRPPPACSPRPCPG